MDGIGGAASVSSKTAIISRSDEPACDVDYCFGQVAIDRPVVEYNGNCGNISAAVGPFAIDEGLVAAVEPVTRVRIFRKNTGKRIIAEVPVKGGRFDEEGDHAISGVPGTGSRIVLRFAEPGGN
jgi:2-methylaconitate cis-trans-isomerase PrpF